MAGCSDPIAGSRGLGMEPPGELATSLAAPVDLAVVFPQVLLGLETQAVIFSPGLPHRKVLRGKGENCS